MNNKQYGTFYQARLISKMGRKTIGLGSDRIQALNLALMVDEEIHRLTTNELPIELDTLKAMVENQKEATKLKKEKGIRLIEKDSLAALWDKYVKFHRAISDEDDGWGEVYYLTHIKTVTSLIDRCPVQKLEHKHELIEWLFGDEKRTKKTSQDRLKLIVAAIDWNSKQGNIPRKWGIEYRDLLLSIVGNGKKKKKKSKIQDEDDIDIFSIKEIYQILEALKDDTYSRCRGKHKQYYLYAYFLFLTGCRPNEAVALKWENVDLVKKKIKFLEGEVNASGTIVKKQGTKTVNSRLFPITREIENLLKSIPHRKGYVFLNDRGKAISQQSFCRIWRLVLECMNIRHRVPYQLRHSMISYYANNDYPVHKLAEICGNSEKIIKEHYLRLNVEKINLPEINLEDI
ncbi:tyrosine-type recombinase/integrase [Leptolyngbya sp. AN10]